MSSGFDYTQQHGRETVKNFSHLRVVILWAGILGVVQAVIWAVLAIFGILHYNCLIPIDNKVTYGSIVKFVFFELYFHGNCKPDVYASVNYDVMNTVDTVVSPDAILIWTCIYLAIMVFWLLSSIMLIKYLERDDIGIMCANLYIWAMITLLVCIQDLVLGIFFAIDYGRFNTTAYGYNLATYEAGELNPDAVQLIAGEMSALCMMFISMKGFILWIVNCGLMVYLLMNALAISGVINDDDSSEYPNQTECDDVQPIRAYDHPPRKIAAYKNDGFVAESKPTTITQPLELNQDAIARAARIAMDACLQDRRFRNLDSYQQFSAKTVTAAVPAPDYTPPMRRGASPPQNNGHFRNSRF